MNVCILDKTGVGAEVESQLNMTEKARSSPHWTVALTCVFGVMFGQYKPYDNLWRLRIFTHSHTVLKFYCSGSYWHSRRLDSWSHDIRTGRSLPQDECSSPQGLLSAILHSCSLQAGNYVVKKKNTNTHTAGTFWMSTTWTYHSVCLCKLILYRDSRSRLCGPVRLKCFFSDFKTALPCVCFCLSSDREA